LASSFSNESIEGTRHHQWLDSQRSVLVHDLLSPQRRYSRLTYRLSAAAAGRDRRLKSLTNGLLIRKINPDLQPLIHDIWVEKSPKSPRRVKDLQHNARGHFIQSNNLAAGLDRSPLIAAVVSGDKTFSPLSTRRSAATRLNTSGILKTPPSNLESPNNVDVISPFATSLGRSELASALQETAETQGIDRFNDESPRKTGGEEDGGGKSQARRGTAAPDFKSTSYRCGSFDPRVPPPLLGRVQPLITWQQRNTSELLPTLPAAGCPLLRAKMQAKPYGGDPLHRPWAVG
jgi:hypothetical protein